MIEICECSGQSRDNLTAKMLVSKKDQLLEFAQRVQSSVPTQSRGAVLTTPES